MKKFSEIKKEQPLKDQLLESWSLQTGYDKVCINKLYDNLLMQIGMNESIDFETLNSKFNLMFNDESNSILVNFNTVFNEVDLVINTPEIPLPEKYYSITKLLDGLNFNDLNTIKDTPLLLMLINNIRDILKRFRELIMDYFNSNELNESYSDFDKNKTDNLLLNLNESLLSILVKKESEFGNNFYIGNLWENIIKEIKNESIVIANKDNIFEIENKDHEFILMQILNNQLDTMYLMNNVIKNLVPDLETLIYDLCVIVNGYVKNNKFLISFVHPVQIEKYNKYLNEFITKFFNCYKTSLIIDTRIDKSPMNINDNNRIDYIYWEKFDVYNKIINAKQALQSLHIIKNVTCEFNLNSRVVINNFVTSAINLIQSIEKKQVLADARNRNLLKN